MADPPPSPTRLGARSWAAALRRTVDEFGADHLTDRAAALTYFGVLALFPSLIALVSIVGLFGDPEATTDLLTEIVSGIGPQSAVETFEQPIANLTENRSRAGLLFVAGLLGALYSASGYIGAFARASNAIYEVEEGRPW